MCSAETTVVICLFWLVNPKTYLLAELTVESHLHVSTRSQTAQAAVKLCASGNGGVMTLRLLLGNGVMTQHRLRNI